MTTEVTWTSPGGRTADLTYDVTPDRVRRHAAMVRLRLVPRDAVKQADVTLLAYPWENPQSAAVTRADLDWYVPRTDPGGRP